METRSYLKIVLIIASVSLVFSLIPATFMIPTLFMPHGPWNQPQPIEKNSADEAKILSHINELDSVNTFKELFPDYREDFVNDGHRVHKSYQAINGETGNVLVLNVQYQVWDENYTEDVYCKSSEPVDEPIPQFYPPFREQGNNLFIDEAIKKSKCLE